MSGSQTVLVPGISLCLFFPCPGAVASPLAPSPLLCSKGSIQSRWWPWLQLQPALPTAPSTSLPPKLAPARLPTCQEGSLAGLEVLQMMHPQSSGWRALQPRSSSQPSPASPGALGEGFVFQNPSGGWGHKKGFVQPAPGSGASWGQQESTGSWAGGGRGMDLGCWVQPLVFLGATTCWDSPAVLHL